MAMTLEQEVKEAIKKLQSLPKSYSRRRKRILRTAAAPLISAARRNIPRSTKPHHRYNTSKASSSIRAPKGEGKIIATYYPGNLRRSIQRLNFRKSKDIFVGPLVSKRGKGGGTFNNDRVDGYYANQMEFGNRNHEGVAFMRKAVDSTTGKVQNIIIKESTKTIENFIKKNKI